MSKPRRGSCPSGGFLVTGECHCHHERCCELVELQNAILLVFLLLEDLKEILTIQNLLDVLNSSRPSSSCHEWRVILWSFSFLLEIRDPFGDVCDSEWSFLGDILLPS
jgi:hypothetical protein